ncbi:MAG TPA: phosphomethylpyrimidine synthase ThiC [Desulfobacteraceae bacterium]|nr:phosphomethylpyrimidine synthase ThiC [Desulfobacteraceae bacterium]
MTQLLVARSGNRSPQMQIISEKEGIPLESLRKRISEGKVVIPSNKNHTDMVPCGIGQGLSVKVNANIGTSSDRIDLDEELKKLKAALDAGADTVMDLSTGGDLDHIRRKILENCPVPLGTVPIYQAVIETINEKGGLIHLSEDKIFEVIERHARDGVDFITVHCGVTLDALTLLRSQGRITDIVSRGGAFLTTWMLYHKKENPLYEHFDEILSIAKKYDVTLSLGDGLRPGSIADSTDRAQIHELITLGDLTKRAWEAGVQVMIEGPGHVPLNQIRENVRIQKSLCHNAPFYVLGPLVTDIAAGHDHVACAIGGAVAAEAGADFLCYVTPAEHLSLPTVEDVREGVIITKIAAHTADIARGNPKAIEWDRKMSEARKRLDWKTQLQLAIDPIKARKIREKSPPKQRDVCTMCGKYCAIKQVRDYFKK